MIKLEQKHIDRYWDIEAVLKKLCKPHTLDYVIDYNEQFSENLINTIEKLLDEQVFLLSIMRDDELKTKYGPNVVQLKLRD